MDDEQEMENSGNGGEWKQNTDMAWSHVVRSEARENFR